MGYIAKESMQRLKVAVVDSSGYFTEARIIQANNNDKSSVLELAKGNEAELKAKYKEMGYDGYVIVPAVDWKEKKETPLLLQSGKSYGTASIEIIKSKLNRIWNEIKNDSLQIDPNKQSILSESRLALSSRNINDEKADAKTAEGIGYVCGFLIYLILLIYGSQVMMGVMEEKTNRIAEVIVSSVKPFQMMLG